MMADTTELCALDQCNTESTSLQATTNHESHAAVATDSSEPARKRRPLPLESFATQIVSGCPVRKRDALRVKGILSRTGHSILFEEVQKPHATSGSKSTVFKITELLELILSHLTSFHLLTAAQLTCRGFKCVIENSPTLQQKLTFALHTTKTKSPLVKHTTSNYPPFMLQFYTARLNSSATWNLAPKDLVFYFQEEHQLWFKFNFQSRPLAFEQHRASASFRRLRVVNSMPQRVDVTLVERNDPPSGRIFLFEPKEGVSSRRFLLEAKDGEVITFGQIFDASAKEKEVGAGMRIDRLVFGVDLPSGTYLRRTGRDRSYVPPMRWRWGGMLEG